MAEYWWLEAGRLTGRLLQKSKQTWVNCNDRKHGRGEDQQQIFGNLNRPARHGRRWMAIEMKEAKLVWSFSLRHLVEIILYVVELFIYKFPQWFSGKESACSARDMGDIWYLGQEDSPGGGSGNPLQYPCLVNKFRGQGSLVGYSPWGHKEKQLSDWAQHSSRAVCVMSFVLFKQKISVNIKFRCIYQAAIQVSKEGVKKRSDNGWE